MTRKPVFCIATSEFQAATVVDRLTSAGFPTNDISVLFPDKSGTRDLPPANGTNAPASPAAGAGTAANPGGTLGWLASIGALAIPGVGSLIVAGPLAAALSGAAVAGPVRGIAGALIGMGLPELEAKTFEGKVKAGGILVAVHPEAADEAKLAHQIFEEEDVDDIAVAGEAAAYERAGARWGS